MAGRIEGTAAAQTAVSDVASALWRRRAILCVACASIGSAAAFESVPWRAAPLLVAALVLVAATLVFAIATRHAQRLSGRAVAFAIGGLAALDAGALVLAGRESGGTGLLLLLVLMVASSATLHAAALAHLVSEAGHAAGPEREERLAALHAAAATIREQLGIVRARAEAIALAAADSGADATLLHDLEVLSRHADHCQRAVREILAAIEGHVAAARLPRPAPARLRSLPEADAWPSESTPQRS